MKRISVIFLFISLLTATVLSTRAEEYSLRFYDDPDGGGAWALGSWR